MRLFSLEAPAVTTGPDLRARVRRALLVVKFSKRLTSLSRKTKVSKTVDNILRAAHRLADEIARRKMKLGKAGSGSRRRERERTGAAKKYKVAEDQAPYECIGTALSQRWLRPVPLPREWFGTCLPDPLPENYLFNGDCERFIDHAKSCGKRFDLIFSSPPYNLGKSYGGYADDRDLDEYLTWQAKIISKCVERLTPTGSICWQVGNYVSNGHVVPLDLEMAPIFKKLGLKLRNRVVWHFGHGLHCSRRFSGRYEVVLWYSKSENYKFNLDAVRVPSKYPNKKHFKGPRKGELSGNPLGKNPSDAWIEAPDIGDFWDIPNVKHNHVEKTAHPCQFPIGLVQRFLLALTDPGDAVFDPFLGVGSAAACAAHFGRHYFGCELAEDHFKTARHRTELAASRLLPFRDPNIPIYQPPKQRAVAIAK